MECGGVVATDEAGEMSRGQIMKFGFNPESKNEQHDQSWFLKNSLKVCVVGWEMDTPKDIHIKSLKPVNSTFFVRRIFADVINVIYMPTNNVYEHLPLQSLPLKISFLWMKWNYKNSFIHHIFTVCLLRAIHYDWMWEYKGKPNRHSFYPLKVLSLINICLKSKVLLLCEDVGRPEY